MPHVLRAVKSDQTLAHVRRACGQLNSGMCRGHSVSRCALLASLRAGVPDAQAGRGRGGRGWEGCGTPWRTPNHDVRWKQARRWPERHTAQLAIDQGLIAIRGSLRASGSVASAALQRPRHHIFSGAVKLGLCPLISPSSPQHHAATGPTDALLSRQGTASGAGSQEDCCQGLRCTQAEHQPGPCRRRTVPLRLGNRLRRESRSSEVLSCPAAMPCRRCHNCWAQRPVAVRRCSSAASSCGRPRCRLSATANLNRHNCFKLTLGRDCYPFAIRRLAVACTTGKRRWRPTQRRCCARATRPMRQRTRTTSHPPLTRTSR
jgi:hypothetical protein